MANNKHPVECNNKRLVWWPERNRWHSWLKQQLQDNREHTRYSSGSIAFYAPERLDELCDTLLATNFILAVLNNKQVDSFKGKKTEQRREYGNLQIKVKRQKIRSNKRKQAGVKLQKNETAIGIWISEKK